MGMESPDKVVRLILDSISDEGVSVHQIVCKTGLNHRTVEKYVNMVVDIQKSRKIVKSHIGLRVIIKTGQ